MMRASSATCRVTRCISVGLCLCLTLVALVLTGCPEGGGNLPSPKPGPPGPNGKANEHVSELLALLEQLPKDKQPENNRDSLRITQAKRWYEENLVGRQAKLTIPFPPDKFGEEPQYVPEFRGLYFAQFSNVNDRLKLSAFQLRVDVSSWNYGPLALRKLTEQTVERLRQWPKDRPLQLVFSIKQITFPDAGGYQYMWVEVNDAILLNLDP